MRVLRIWQREVRLTVLWTVTLCRRACGSRRFGGTYCLRIQGSGGPTMSLRQAWDQSQWFRAVRSCQCTSLGLPVRAVLHALVRVIRQITCVLCKGKVAPISHVTRIFTKRDVVLSALPTRLHCACVYFACDCRYLIICF